MRFVAVYNMTEKCFDGFLNVDHLATMLVDEYNGLVKSNDTIQDVATNSLTEIKDFANSTDIKKKTWVVVGVVTNGERVLLSHTFDTMNDAILRLHQIAFKLNRNLD